MKPYYYYFDMKTDYNKDYHYLNYNCSCAVNV